MSKFTESIPNSIGIFRLQLFKLSETFISNQFNHYRNYTPFYMGRSLHAPPPGDADVVKLPSGLTATAKALLIRDPNVWRHAIGNRSPKLIHAHFAIDAAVALPLAQARGIPLVTTLHAFDVTKKDSALLSSGKFNETAFVARRAQLQRSGALFVCVSDYIRHRALERGYPAERTVTLPIGINTTRLVPPPADAKNPGLIVHVARLVEKKGTSDLIKAFSIVSRDIPHSELVIVGTGPLEGDLQRLVASLQLNERVRFLGAQSHSETLDWIGKAAVLAVPSVTAKSGDVEGLPTVIFEASALGVPTVGTLHAGIPEAIIDGQTGRLVSERDVSALASALLQVLGNEESSRELGKQARKLVIDKYNVEQQTSMLEELYSSILGGAARHSPEIHKLRHRA